MTKLITLSLASLLTLQLSAQLLIKDADGNLISGSTDTISSTSDISDVSQDFEVTNVGSTKTYKVKKHELNAVSGSDNAFCWGVCSIPVANGTNTFQESGSLSVEQNATKVYSCHLYPNRVTGQSKFRYVWYDVNNPMDTTFIDVLFQIAGSSSKEEVSFTAPKVSAFPNPSRSSRPITVSIEGVPGTAKVYLMSLVGEIVQVIETDKASFKLPTEDLNGLYFLRLEKNGKVVSTKKLVIE